MQPDCLFIGSDSKGIAEEVINGVDGFLFKSGSASSLADLLQKILLNPDSIDRIKKNIQMPQTFNVVVKQVNDKYLVVTKKISTIK